MAVYGGEVKHSSGKVEGVGSEFRNRKQIRSLVVDHYNYILTILNRKENEQKGNFLKSAEKEF